MARKKSIPTSSGPPKMSTARLNSSVRVSQEALDLARRAAMLKGISMSAFINDLILEHTLDVAIRDSEEFLKRAKQARRSHTTGVLE